MSEQGATLRFTNLTDSLEWRDYHNLFSEYGKVTKLYIEPNGEFGRVEFENVNNALKAQKGLNGKPPYNLDFGNPAKSTLKNKNLSSTSSDTSSLSQDKMASSFDDISAVSSKMGYVDVFGRVLDTVESEDGEIYVPVRELKKSGFEVFMADTLPKQGQLPYFDEQLYQQYENYLQIKATKFVMRNNFRMPEDRVSHIFAKLKQKYMKYHRPETTVTNKNGMLIVTSSPHQHQQERDRTNWNDQPRSHLRSPYSMEDTANRSHSRSTPRNTNEYYEDRQFKSNAYKGRGHQNNELFNTTPGNVYKGRSRNNNSNDNNRESLTGPFYNNTNRGQGRRNDSDRTQNSNKPRQNRNFNNNNRKETHDSKFSANTSSSLQTIENASKPLNTKEICKLESPRQEKSVTPTSDDIENIKPSLRPPNSIIDSKPESIPHSVTFSPEVVEENRSSRTTIIENISTCGLFQCTKILTNDTFVGAAMPTEYAEEVYTLEEIFQDITPDASFKPTVGDLVAVPKDDFYARGIVINDSNNKYECAFIDFGTTDSVDKVYHLPDKYKDIPEFACLCKTTPEAVQELSKKMGADVFHPLEIKKPFALTVTIEETKNSFELQGSRWDPVATSKPVIKQQTTYKVEPSKYKLQTNEIVMITSVQDGCLLVRTKEAALRLKEVNQEANSLQVESLEKEPEVNQMVLSSNKNHNYRARVIKVENSNALVQYIDYGNLVTVPTKELNNVSESVANMDYTLLLIKLHGFVDHEFSDKEMAFLNECYETKEKLTAVSKSEDNDIFDLVFKDKTSLSEKLMSLGKPEVTEQPPKNEASIEAKSISPKDDSKSKLITIADIPKCELAKGKNTMMSLFTGDLESGIATFCLADDESMAAMADLSEKILEYVDKDDKPYHPQKNEVCLARFEGEWFRAVYLLDSGDEYGMFYCDYGNTQSTSANDLRKMPKDLANIRCCAAFCTLEGLPYEDEKIKENVFTELKTLLPENEIYEIETVEETDGCYSIRIPSIYSTLQQKGLL